jgi:hypothetical protein
MPHVLESARTGRAKCRGCGQPIAVRTLRLGERVPNPFSDDGGETTLWYHVPCAAFLRPEAFLAVMAETTETIPDRAHLEQEAQLGAAHRRLPRVAGAGRAPTGRATCRACKQPITKGAWRLALVYYDEGRFAPSGFLHPACAASYLETTQVLGRLRHFSPELDAQDLAAVAAELGAELGSDTGQTRVRHGERGVRHLGFDV